MLWTPSADAPMFEETRLALVWPEVVGGKKNRLILFLLRGLQTIRDVLDVHVPGHLVRNGLRSPQSFFERAACLLFLPLGSQSGGLNLKQPRTSIGTGRASQSAITC